MSRDEGMFWLSLQAKLGLYSKASHSVIVTYQLAIFVNFGDYLGEARL